MPPELTLFSTEYCHLCEEAEAILKHAGLQWQNVDITENDTLLELYSLRIPVVRREDTRAELGWPFTLEEIARFTAR